MIASLSGSVLELNASQCVLDVQGVGYLVAITPQTSRELTRGSTTTLLISMIVREDAMLLFGFNTPSQRDLFDLLRSVSGVGPKSAMAILGDLDPIEIANAVANEDDKAFSRVSGIGPKTAKLLIVALAGRLKTAGVVSTDAVTENNSSVRTSVLQALSGLGISVIDAETAIDQVLTENEMATRDVLLKETLARIGAAKAQR